MLEEGREVWDFPSDLSSQSEGVRGNDVYAHACGRSHVHFLAAILI